MAVPLKLNAIEQEHLQEVYDAAGIARDELPYTETFDKMVEDFQGRTFKNATQEQVFGALLKYVKSSSCAAKDAEATILDAEQVKTLKMILKRHGKSSKLVPYSSEFESALREFNNITKLDLPARDFWQSICRSQNRSRKPPTRKATAKVARDEDGEDDGE